MSYVVFKNIFADLGMENIADHWSQRLCWRTEEKKGRKKKKGTERKEGKEKKEEKRKERKKNTRKGRRRLERVPYVR